MSTILTRWKSLVRIQRRPLDLRRDLQETLQETRVSHLSEMSGRMRLTRAHADAFRSAGRIQQPPTLWVGSKGALTHAPSA
jgi:hypothetical protein